MGVSARESEKQRYTKNKTIVSKMLVKDTESFFKQKFDILRVSEKRDTMKKRIQKNQAVLFRVMSFYFVRVS